MRAGRFAKGIVLGAITSSAVLIGTAALAGNGVGASFNLGKVNTVNATSTLTGKSSGAMLTITNNGSGRALRLNVKPGTPPLSVSSRAAVSNLTAGNAEHLGGVPPDGFVRGPGVAQSERVIAIPPSSTLIFDPTVPAGPRVTCSATDMTIRFGPSSRHDRDLWWTWDTSTTSAADSDFEEVPQGSSSSPILVVAGDGQFGSVSGIIGNTQGQFLSQSITFEFGAFHESDRCLVHAQMVFVRGGREDVGP
jgi:hypothetical protein